MNGKWLHNVFRTRYRNDNCTSRVPIADIILYHYTGPRLLYFRPDCRIEIYLDYITVCNVTRRYSACSASTDSNSLWICSLMPAFAE